MQPSLKREGFTTVPGVTWADIGALDKVRNELQCSIVQPIRDPDSYRRFGLTAPAGVLLWGPPGCGKTLLAKAVANESGTLLHSALASPPPPLALLSHER